MMIFYNKSRFKYLLLAFCVSFVLSPVFAGPEELSPLQPFKTDTPPKIDGVLDDPVWQHAPNETGFKTWTPDYGIEMKENTVVYYAYDRENLYFAYRCFDSQPDKIKASVNSRDNIQPDDWVCINLDTFNNQQSLYAFYCNPLGIQGDSRFAGGREDFSVDVVWYSEGRIDDKGYTIELRIPFKSIRFSHKDPVEMGVVFERRISRLSEAGTYPPLDPVQGPNFLTQTRALLFKDVKKYRLIEILPAVTYNRRSALESGKLSPLGDIGGLSLTAKYGITSELIFDATINPDFSQVESDAGQVDFNQRYALFYPEKRPFFMEGLEKFNFGGYHSGDPFRAVVHTRTIGDPILGMKLNGKVGRNNTLALIYAVDDLPDAYRSDYAHVGILRYKHALTKDSFIGGFFTDRERDDGYNRLFGADGQMRINQSSIFSGFAFLSRTHNNEAENKSDGHAVGTHYFYNTRDWIIMLGLQDFSRGFGTEVGYLTRTDITRFRSGVLHSIFPKSSILKRIDPVIHSMQIKDKASGLYETNNSFDVTFTFPRNTYLRVGGRYATEAYLQNRFNINRFRFMGSSQVTKQLSLALTYTYGNKIRYLADPYQGRGNDMAAALSFLPSDKLHLDFSLIYSDFTRSADGYKEYDYLIIRNKDAFQVNKYLFFRTIFEYNSFRKQFTTDFLASFTYIPGTVVHFGYGSLYEKIEWIEGELRPADRFLETKRGFFFKASYLWRW